MNKESYNDTGITVSAINLSSSVGIGENKLMILDNLNFYLKPGTLTLLLGAPGCGKTSLFRVLSNQLHGENVTGSLLFNNEYAKPNHHKKVSYVNQDDSHIASLTVRQTIKFSADCQLNEDEDSKNKKVDEILEMLDLVKHQDTLVGNNFIRGISGGQKKRVTVGVELVKDSDLYLMDEISTGLDSTTTFDIINKFRNYAKAENKTFLISLLQPGIEVTKLFDNLLILAQGKMAYFGLLENGIDYFEKYGFKLPVHHNPSEFFQEIIDEPELYYSDKDLVPLKGANDFSEAFLKSKNYQILSEELNQLVAPTSPSSSVSTASSDKVNNESQYYISHYRQGYLNTLRAFRMLSRNPIAIYIRIIKSVVVGLMLGSLYYGLDTNYTDGNNRFNLLFYSLLFIVFGGMGSVSILFDQRDVYFSQKDRKYYHPFAYFTSLTAVEIPLSALEAILFSTLIYWMCGLNADGWKFIYFLLIIFISNVFSNSFFKMVSSFSSTQTFATIVAPMLIAPFILFCGFLMPKKVIGGWWIWMYWIVPTKYMFEGLMSNEYHGVNYSCDDDELLPPTFDPLLNLNYSQGGFNGARACPYTNGDQYLDHFGMPQNSWFKWIDLLISVAYTLAVLFGLYFFLSKIHFDSRLMKKENMDNRKKRLAQQKKLKSKSHKGASNNQQEVSLSIINQQDQSDNGNGSYMQWNNIYYEVEVKKDGKKEKVQLLKGISGYVKPGMLLALMGPSGAGKSTLLDVLSDRKTGGKIKGEITIDGKPKGRNFTRISAYVEQFDILPPTQTVREALLFSANLRLPSTMSKQEKVQFVDYVIDTLNLNKISNKLIGSGEGGLSISQRKRVSIGIELAADPQLLFLDEPTSGLDSSSALKVMNLIKKIASSGRSIICTIHQPSTTIFKKFDHLLLLKKGGETVYFGPTGEMSSDVLGYFENHGVVCDPLKNPADFILDITNNDQFDAVSLYKQSQIYQSLTQAINNNDNSELQSNSNNLVINDKSKYSSSSKVQFNYLMNRLWKSQIRRPIILGVRLGMSLMMGIVLGTFFVRMDTSQKQIFNRMSLLFFSLIFSAMTCMSFIPVVTTERGVFYREKTSGIYRVWVFAAAFILTDLPWVFISSILLSTPLYFISGLYLTEHGASFFYYLFILFTTFVNYQLLAILLAIVLPNDEIANAFAGICLAITCLYSGFMIPFGSVAAGWKWFTYLDFVRYPLEMVMVNEFKHLKFNCENNKDAVEVQVPLDNGTYVSKFYCPIQNGEQVLQKFEFKDDNLYTNIPIIFSFSIMFLLFIYIGLKYIRYQVK